MSSRPTLHFTLCSQSTNLPLKETPAGDGGCVGTEGYSSPLNPPPKFTAGWLVPHQRPQLLLAGCSTATPCGSALPSPCPSRPSGAGTGGLYYSLLTSLNCQYLSKQFLQSPWLPSSVCFLPEPSLIHTTLSRR